MSGPRLRSEVDPGWAPGWQVGDTGAESAATGPQSPA